MLRPYIGSLALAGVGYVLFTRSVAISTVSVIVVGLVFIALYGPLCVVLGALEPQDERLLRSVENRFGIRFATVRSMVRRLRLQ